jgi:hypothetical protein
VKFAEDARPKWLLLYSRAFGTPYATVMSTVERLADCFEHGDGEFTYDQYGLYLVRLENAEGFILSVQDIGEILVLLGSYWAEGEKFLSSLSYLDQKLVAENVEHRLTVLAQDAQKRGIEQ